MSTRRHVDLRDLTERIRAIEQRHETAPNRYVDEPVNDRIPTGWAEIDAQLGGGLSAGGLHEWFGVEEALDGDAARSTGRRWSPPLCILVHLAWQALDHAPSEPWTLWIGGQCHPYPRVLIRGEDRRLLERSLFVAPRDAASRLWAIDLALRSPAVGCVVADGSHFDRPATQRVQLLARSQGKLVLSACPPKQRDELSAAQTRWRIRAAPPPEDASKKEIHPRWSVELLRCKGVRPAQSHCVWRMEWNRGQGAVHLSARLADLAGPPQKQAPRSERPRRQQTA